MTLMIVALGACCKTSRLKDQDESMGGSSKESSVKGINIAILLREALHVRIKAQDLEQNGEVHLYSFCGV